MELTDGIYSDGQINSSDVQFDPESSQRNAYSVERAFNGLERPEMDYLPINDTHEPQYQSDSESMESISEQHSQNTAQTLAGRNQVTQEQADEYLLDNSEYDDEELEPFAYARHHGLTTSYLQEHLFRAAGTASSPAALCGDLKDPDAVLKIGDIVKMKNLTGIAALEKWDVDKETATFLASILALGRDEGPIYSVQPDSSIYLRDLKLEEPFLNSDPEIDVWRLKIRNTIAISSDGMQPFALNDERGESFAWSTNEMCARAEKDKSIASEKLDIDQETMRYVNEVMSLGWPVNEEKFDADISHNMGPLSPPLLPMSPPPSLGGPSNSAMEMAFTSSPVDLNANEAANMERRIMKHDDIISPKLSNLQPQCLDEDVDPKSIYSPLCTPENSSSSPSRHRRIQDLEVDVPLIPQDAVELPLKKVKTVSFPAELYNTVPSPNGDVLKSDSNQDVGTFMAEVIKPSAELAIDQAENERLIEMNTTMRFVVPDIEDIELSPPWKRSSDRKSTTSSHRQLLLGTKSDFAKSEMKWSGVSKVERLMLWTPFPTPLDKVQLEETFEDGSLSRYMAEITFENDVDIEGLIWKPEGLRVLDAKESDDEELKAMDCDEDIDQAQTPLTNLYATGAPTWHPTDAMLSTRPNSKVTKPQRMDMQTLLRKRKLELEAADGSKRLAKELDQTRTDTNHSYESISPPTPVEAGLSNFMHLHGGQAKISNIPKKQPVPTLQQSAPPAVMVQPKIKCNEQNLPDMSLLMPEIKDVEKQISVVLSSELGDKRLLVRHLLNALPRVDLVERDPIALLGKNSRAMSKHGNRYEADITISPSTGLVLTTLQKLKQKPLPGQSTFFGVRDRIQDVAVRYERLIILVNEGRQPIDSGSALAGPLDETDSEALSNLSGFGAALSTDMEVYYVAGGEQELAKWIAVFISRHSTPEISTKLIHDETLWERFLRHAGLNAYAAQAMLSKLKRSDGSQVEWSSPTADSIATPPHGLAALVEMEAEQRVKQFGALMRGGRVIRRLGEAIDSHWTSVSTMK